MTHYLVLGATRIQQWISRTTPLFLVRGASAALTRRTSKEHLTPKLSHLPVRISDDVADIAGVVVLESDAPITGETAQEALTIVSAELPGIEWSAWASEADSYIDAYRDTQAGQRATQQWRRPPLITKIPLLEVCDGCHDETATSTHHRLGEELRLGPDCLVRYKHAYGHEKNTDGKSSLAGEFADLAALGISVQERSTTGRLETAGRGTRDNHIATIAADGNRIGGFFSQVAKAGDQRLHAALSRALDSAARRACADAQEAARTYVPYAKVEPDVIHYVGGDDIVATVAAQVAWPWVLTLGTRFEEHFAEAVASIDTIDEELVQAASEVSLGIGVVFSHATYPFALSSQVATRAEAQAKRAVRGGRSAVAWADLTAESGLPDGRFIDVASARGDLTGFWAARLGRASRQVLAGLLRPHPSHGPDPDPEILHTVEAWATRTGVDDLLTLCQENRSPAETLTIIRNDLDRSRWWPKPGKEQP